MVFLSKQFRLFLSAAQDAVSGPSNFFQSFGAQG